MCCHFSGQAQLDFNFYSCSIAPHVNIFEYNFPQNAVSRAWSDRTVLAVRVVYHQLFLIDSEHFAHCLFYWGPGLPFWIASQFSWSILNASNCPVIFFLSLRFSCTHMDLCFAVSSIPFSSNLSLSIRARTSALHLYLYIKIYRKSFLEKNSN